MLAVASAAVVVTFGMDVADIAERSDRRSSQDRSHRRSFLKRTFDNSLTAEVASTFNYWDTFGGLGLAAESQFLD
jgi:hypothetical protein